VSAPGIRRSELACGDHHAEASSLAARAIRRLAPFLHLRSAMPFRTSAPGLAVALAHRQLRETLDEEPDKRTAEPHEVFPFGWSSGDERSRQCAIKRTMRLATSWPALQKLPTAETLTPRAPDTSPPSPTVSGVRRRSSRTALRA